LLNFVFSYKPVIYAIKTLIGGMICWYGLLIFGVSNPIWAIITVVIVSDPDLTTAISLARMRVINTIVGCTIGLLCMVFFGYGTMLCLLAMAFTVFLVTSIDRYPVNWRLAPVTVVILMNAGKDAVSRHEEIRLALMRAGEIGFGCVVALGLAYGVKRFGSKYL